MGKQSTPFYEIILVILMPICSCIGKYLKTI